MNLDWKNLVKNIAPTIGTALGGPAAGVAVRYLAESFLDEPDATEAQLAQVIQSASPEKLLELKALDNDFAIKMRELDVDVFRLEVEDKQNARETLKISIWPQVSLSCLFVLGYFSIMGLLVINHDLDINDRVFGILNTVIGVLTAAIPMILQFWFGSSQGSKEKDKKLGVSHGRS